MKLAISTQIRENYGAHDWDGTGACPQYWKCKGGNTYVVPNLTPAQVLKIKEGGIPTLKGLIESSDIGFQESIIDWSILDNDEVVGEAWDTPIDLFYTGGRWLAMITTENGEYGYMNREILRKTEEYTLVEGGGRKDYKAVYTMRDGTKVTMDRLNDYLQHVAM